MTNYVKDLDGKAKLANTEDYYPVSVNYQELHYVQPYSISVYADNTIKDVKKRRNKVRAICLILKLLSKCVGEGYVRKNAHDEEYHDYLEVRENTCLLKDFHKTLQQTHIKLCEQRAIFEDLISEAQKNLAYQIIARGLRLGMLEDNVKFLAKAVVYEGFKIEIRRRALPKIKSYNSYTYHEIWHDRYGERASIICTRLDQESRAKEQDNV